MSHTTIEGLMDEYILSQPMQGVWSPLEESNVWPPMRGGHQLCVDHTQQCLYLFGGWDGSRELSDLWHYSIEQHHWTCLCQDTTLEVMY